MPRLIDTGSVNQRKRAKIGAYQFASRPSLCRHSRDLLPFDFVEEGTLPSVRLSYNDHSIVQSLQNFCLGLLPVDCLHEALYHTNSTRKMLESTDTKLTY